MGHSTTTVIESQVDWLTASAHGAAPSSALADLAYTLAGEERGAGNQLRKWRLMGYEGSMVGRVRWGRRDDSSCLVQLSGEVAEQAIDAVTAIASNITRVDIATTVRTATPDPHVASNAYLMACAERAKHPTLALPTRVVNDDGGETVYLGKRTSEYFFRLYNKEAESAQADDIAGLERYANCWRYELECKGSIAEPLALSLAGHPDRPTYVQQYLYDYCRRHGVEPIYGGSSDRLLIPGFRRRSDATSRLQHLERNVRPTVDWLRSEGRLADVLDVLGLSASYVSGHFADEGRDKGPVT